MSRNPTARMDPKNSPNITFQTYPRKSLIRHRSRTLCICSDKFPILRKVIVACRLFVASCLAGFCIMTSCFESVRNFLPPSRTQRKEGDMTISCHVFRSPQTGTCFPQVMAPLHRNRPSSQKEPVQSNTLYLYLIVSCAVAHVRRE